MMNGKTVLVDKHNHVHGWCGKHICWTAIFAGAFVGIGISFLLNLFSIAIGLSVFPTTREGAMTLAVGGMVGMAIGIFVAMFVAGWVAGYLGRPFCAKRNLGVLYGFTTWAVALVITILLAAHVGRFVSNYNSFIANPSSITVVSNASPTGTPEPANTTQVAVANPGSLALTAFVAFALFALGALAACVGGHSGMICRRDEDFNAVC